MILTYPPELLPIPELGEEVEIVIMGHDNCPIILRVEEAAALAPAQEAPRFLFKRARLRQAVDR